MKLPSSKTCSDCYHSSRIRQITRTSFDFKSTTKGVAVRIGRIELGVGWVKGRHVWYRVRTGNPQDNPGRKLEIQVWRVISALAQYEKAADTIPIQTL